MPEKPRILESSFVWPVVVSSLLGLLITACYVAQGLLLAQIIFRAMTGQGFAEFTPLVAALAATIIARAVLLWLSEIAAQRTGQVVKVNLRNRLLKHLFDLGPGVTLRQPTGVLQATIVGGVEALETYYSRYLPAIIMAIVGCAGVIVVLAMFDWQSALVLAVFAVAFPILDKLWMRWQMPEISGVFAAMGSFGTYLLDSLQGIVTLKAFGASQRRRDRLAVYATNLCHESMSTLAVGLMRTGLTGLIALSGVAAVLCLNAWRVSSGEIDASVLLVSLFLAREVFRPLDRLEKEFHSAWAASGARASILDLLTMRPSVAEATVKQPKPLAYDVAFEDVDFAYEGADKPALSNLSLTVQEREFVALVGPSGAGKSTVAALLLRFADPQNGSVRIGNREIRDLSLSDLRSLVSVVSQDTFLFHGTIGDNLRLAKLDATEEELRNAARAAHIDQFIQSLPQGYDTEIGERGAQLSGGQRQRLAIARALLKDAPILVLDEATSNVDPASERAIQAAISDIAGQRTVIVIAHRLSTVQAADRILVFENGQIVEQGSPAELMRVSGAYSRLVSAEGEAA